MKYTNNELRDLIDASGTEQVLMEDIDLDSIEDDEVKDICATIKENIENLYTILEDSEFADIQDFDDF